MVDEDFCCMIGHNCIACGICNSYKADLLARNAELRFSSAAIVCGMSADTLDSATAGSP